MSGTKSTPDVAAPATAVIHSTNPETGELVGTFPVMSPEEVGAVVAAAHDAAWWWAGQSWREREGALLNWASWLTAHSQDLVDLVHHEQGKTRPQALLAEIVPTLEHIRWAAKNARKVLRRRHVLPGAMMANQAASVEYLPYGVVGIIGPWNYPVFTPAGQMIAYALAAGNAVVLKPSEYTTAIGSFLVDSFAAANPNARAGIVSLVTGFGETGAALCRAGVDKIAFTGSTATGKRVLSACSESLVPAIVECGGKDAMVVADDADIAAAAKAAAFGGMVNAGQTCVGMERVYVVSAVKDRFVAELKRQLDGVGPAPHADPSYGPMTTPAQVEIIRDHVEEAVGRGAQAIVGGVQAVHAPHIDPVVLLDPPLDSRIVQEETFGPTLTVHTAVDVDDAVRLANCGTFGLGASVYSKRNGTSIARRLRCGMVAINGVMSFAAMPALPFGGVGQSGFGRIHGAPGLREFATPKSYARELFAIPGLDLLTLRPSARSVRLIETVTRARHRRRIR